MANIDFQNIGATTTSPAGSNTEIQFNNAGVFGASNQFTWDNVNSRLMIGSSNIPAHKLVVSNGYIQVDGNYGLSFNTNASYTGNRIDYATYLRFYTSGDLNFITSSKKITIGNSSHLSGSLNIKGIGSSNTTNNIESQNLSGNKLLLLRNNGELNLPLLPTSATGLVAGDLWNNHGVINIV